MVSARSEIPSLVTAEGDPWRTVLQFSLNAKPEEVERELHAQILKARAAGIEISHLTGYHGSVFSRVDLAAAYLSTARKYWIPALVIVLTPEHVERFRREGFPLDQQLIDLIQNYPLPKKLLKV